MSELLEACGAAATMSREISHLTYDGKTALCGAKIHPFESGRRVHRVSDNHCGNCRRVINAHRATTEPEEARDE